MLLQRVITAVVLLIIIIGAFNFSFGFHGGGRDCYRMLLLGVAPHL